MGHWSLITPFHMFPPLSPSPCIKYPMYCIFFLKTFSITQSCRPHQASIPHSTTTYPLNSTRLFKHSRHHIFLEILCKIIFIDEIRAPPTTQGLGVWELGYVYGVHSSIRLGQSPMYSIYIFFKTWDKNLFIVVAHVPLKYSKAPLEKLEWGDNMKLKFYFTNVSNFV